MNLKYSPRFVDELEIIYKFIAKNSPANASKFVKDLKNRIKKIPNSPKSFRKSLIINNENYREFIFKAYIVVFFIDEQLKTIFILGIYKENVWKLKNSENFC